MRKPHSIKKTVLFFDFLIVVPLFILFSILTIAAFRNSNYEWNRSKLASVEERCSNIADRNTEIIKITNMLYLDSEINHILSEKQQLTGYEATQAQGKIQGKMKGTDRIISGETVSDYDIVQQWKQLFSKLVRIYR